MHRLERERQRRLQERRLVARREAALSQPTPAMPIPSRSSARQRGKLSSVPGAIEVTERGRTLRFTFDDVLRYHGPGSPGGAAIGFQALAAALPLLSRDAPCERRELVIDTAFGGPGARDAFEMVTRAITGERFTVDAALERPDRGRVLERFVFRIGYRGRTATLLLREGFVTEEFIELARAQSRDTDQERRLDRLKLELAECVMARPASDVFEVA
jgi:hypothetical protein